MNEKLYQLLNNDASELPKAEMISNQEVNNIMKRFREEKGTLPIKKRRKPMMSAVILAAVIAACGGITVFAANHSHLFKNLESNKTKTHVDDNGTEWKVDKTPDLNNYEMLESFANTEDETEISSNDEISVSIESSYCDGRTLVLGLTGSLSNGNPDGYRYIGFQSIKIDCGDVVFDTAGGMHGIDNYTWLEGNMMLDDGTENSFSGQITLKLLDEYMLTESKNAVITLEGLCAGDDYFNTYAKLNDIIMKKCIVVDNDLINGNAMEQSQDGYKVRLFNYSPASIRVEWEYPSDLDDKYSDDDSMFPLYSMILFFYDEDGNEIPFLNETIGTGSLTTPSSDIIYARILNKQERTDSDLYYGMPVYKEFKFDLSELKSEE
ncbi:MAG: hypothetical protein K2J71_04815 [Oscillospiraceae bacterium]|nr:hypothetical protein [Oscillospiraceae bacterium]